MTARAAPIALASSILLLLSSVAVGQHPAIPMGDTARALHAQLAEADAAAIGTVDVVELGRIRVRDVRPVLGSVAERFEIKRAPSKPPGLRAGRRVVLILAGARSPYLLVSTADEIQDVADVRAEQLWLGALRQVASLRGRPARLEALYVAWLSGEDDALRRAGSVGLRDTEAAFRPLAPERLAALAQQALDPALPVEARRAFAEVAASQREGADALLARLPPAEGADTELLADVLRRGALLRSPEVPPALVRCLRNPDPEVRKVALRFGTLLAGDDATNELLMRLADGDPVEEIRQAAARLTTDRSADRSTRRAAEGSRR